MTATGPDASRGEGRRHRGDLEGLRAIAVILVLAYHANVGWVAGGYVGVDVFFVLSGFLITGLIVRELGATGRVSLPDFYARRARRLLPAAALALLATALLSALILPPLRLPDVAGDIVAAAAYVSNLQFAVQATDYLGAEGAASPVLHFWSLGVEEQFYLFWPALIAVTAGAAFALGDHARGVRRVTLTLAAVFGLSMVTGIVLTNVQQPWAFFSLPSRAWELALGGLLALPWATRLASPRWRAPLGWTGLLMIVAAGLAFDAATPFPGTAALLPTIGAAMVIAAGLQRPGASAEAIGERGRQRPAAVSSLLELPPVRYVGRISYSLYLWHWPLLVLPAVALGGQLSPVEVTGLVGLSVLVAAASQRWVEEPIRLGRFVGHQPRTVLSAAGALTLLVVVAGVGLGSAAQGRLTPSGPLVGGSLDEVVLPNEVVPASPVAPLDMAVAVGEPAAPPKEAAPAMAAQAILPTLLPEPVPADLAPSLAAARDDMPIIYSDGCHLSPAAVDIGSCVYGDRSSGTTVVLWGDSHAAQWFPALQRLAEEQHWRLVSITKSACPSIDVPTWSMLFNRTYKECTAWREAAISRIAKEHPAVVVVSNAFHYSITVAGAMAWSTDHPDIWSAGLERTLRRLDDLSGRVILIGDTPRMVEDPPVCLSEHLDDASRCASAFSDAVAAPRLAEDKRIAARTGATFVEPTPWLCFTEPCAVTNGRLLIYRDTHHMTATFARALASRLGAAALLDAGSLMPRAQ